MAWYTIYYYVVQVMHYEQVVHQVQLSHVRIDSWLKCSCSTHYLLGTFIQNLSQTYVFGCSLLIICFWVCKKKKDCKLSGFQYNLFG